MPAHHRRRQRAGFCGAQGCFHAAGCSPFPPTTRGQRQHREQRLLPKLRQPDPEEKFGLPRPGVYPRRQPRPPRTIQTRKNNLRKRPPTLGSLRPLNNARRTLTRLTKHTPALPPSQKDGGRPHANGGARHTQVPLIRGIGRIKPPKPPLTGGLPSRLAASWGRGCGGGGRAGL